MNQIRPILSTLTRHKSAVLILMLEVALTCAILCNAINLVRLRVDAINSPLGIDESVLSFLQVSGIGNDANALALSRTDKESIRAIPGVESVALVNQTPLQNGSWNSSFELTPDARGGRDNNATLYMGDDDMVRTFGAHIVRGRAFNPEEYLDVPDVAAASAALPRAIIITEAFARRMFPDSDALGKSLYLDTTPIPIVGIVDRLQRPGRDSSLESAQYSVLIPFRQPFTLANYIIRTKPGVNRGEVLKAAVAALQKNDAHRIIGDQKTFAELRDDYYAQQKSMIWLLSGVTLVLLMVTAFGIVGLASFWVQQRTKQIGVRRALGATRGDILRYFQTENFLIVTGGVVLGMTLAFAINQLLMAKYELPRLPWPYLPIGAVVLWLLGQLAVLWPALRAASIPPATATRSV
ncbi:MAG: ABC transporter permease [Proteobacteria bacterium]|nr:ABC transporter permease [Pseudomonadota bacterium]MBS0216889.1 ABC transporter permease [Pseudomonadota bacterium]